MICFLSASVRNHNFLLLDYIGNSLKNNLRCFTGDATRCVDVCGHQKNMRETIQNDVLSTWRVLYLHLFPTCVDEGPTFLRGTLMKNPSSGSFLPLCAGSSGGSVPLNQSTQVSRTDMIMLGNKDQSHCDKSSNTCTQHHLQASGLV